MRWTGLTADNTYALGDRHHRPDPMGKLRDQPQHRTARVRLRVSPALCTGRVGQLGAWLCVNLLARLEGMVTEIELDCSAVSTHPDMRLLALDSVVAPDLRSWLAEVGGRASSGRVAILPASSDSVAAVELVIGGSEVVSGQAAHHIWSFGRGWLASVGSHATVERAEILDGNNPLGMYLAVCYGVGEVFKALKGFKDGESFAIDLIYSSLWSGVSTQAGWNELEDGPTIAQLRLPPTYLVGAGAVGEAGLLALITATAGAEFLTPMDRDRIDLTNRNRYILAFETQEKLNKALFAASVSTAAGVPAHGEPLHWLEYLGRATVHPNAQLAQNEADLRYGLVLSCVDKNRPRHEIQRTWPRDILGASTDSLRAQAVHYDMRSRTACLACHNPIQRLDQVLDELRAKLKGLTAESQYEHLINLGFAPEHIRSALEYLQDPNCGELGESALQKFADDGPPAFAVGFVSVAAGLLLARHWIRYALHGPGGVTSGDRHYLSVNFFNGRFMWHEEGQSETCMCAGGGRDQWRCLWGAT
jgi:molybdopterin/thiamine biosynthesis adenylyltransferase